MASKKRKETGNDLPLNVEQDMEQTHSITYASDVVAIIAGLAASEVEGVAGMCSVNGSLMGKNKNMTRGVKVEVGTEEVSVELYLVVEYGTPIQRAARDAQESVKKSIESMTGLHVVRVDVHVLGVSFEKEMNALQAGAGNAVLESGEAAEDSAREDGEAAEAKDTEAPEKPKTAAKKPGKAPAEPETEKAAEAPSDTVEQPAAPDLPPEPETAEEEREQTKA